MGWTAGVTRTTGDLITAAQWNSYLGASGSLDYLKNEVDKIDDVSGSAPSRALDTIYQNSTKIRLVVLTGIFNVDGEEIHIYIGPSSPPSVYVGCIETRFNENNDIPITFIVPPSYYYRAVSAGSPNINTWYEFNLH